MVCKLQNIVIANASLSTVFLNFIVNDFYILLFLTDGDFLKPYITSHPKTRVALKNDNITLTCQAVSTEDSGTVFIWKKDNVVCTQTLCFTV